MSELVAAEATSAVSVPASSRLTAALHVARVLGPVFPLHSVRAGGCSCEDERCESKGKHPRTGTGFKAATRDEKQIRAWWKAWPDANIGVPTGEASGFFVIDRDPRNGGDETFLALAAKHGPLPRTVTSRTGGGGDHRLLLYPGWKVNCDNRGKYLGRGLDVKGDGGYIVVAPSNHESGARYQWAEGLAPGEVEIATAPAWLLELLKNPQQPRALAPARCHQPPADRLGDARAARYAEGALARAKAAIASAVEGSRNDTLNTEAFGIGQLVGGGLVARAEAERELGAAAMESGLSEIETTKTLRSALNAGELQPRGLPLEDRAPLPTRAREPGEDDGDEAPREVETRDAQAEALAEKRPTVDEVIAELQAAHTAAALTTEVWRELLNRAQLGDVDEKRVINLLGDELLGVGRRAVANELKAYRRAQRREAAGDQVEEAAHGRAILRWVETDLNAMVQATENELIRGGRVYQVDDAYFTVREDELPGTQHVENRKRSAGDRLPAPKQLLLVPMNRNRVSLEIDRQILFTKYNNREGGDAPLKQPEDLPALMLDMQGKRVPRVAGLVSHPIVLPDGRLIASSGLDVASGLYVSADNWMPPRELTQASARAAAARIRALLLGDVLLRDRDSDGSAFIAALLLGVARKGLQQGPAILVNATIQGSGKTALARIIHVILTGRDMPVARMSPDAGEFKKALFAALVRNPAMVCFDNIEDGTTLANLNLGPLAAVLTNPVYSDRILGLTRDTSVRTNTLFVFTGNNITVGTDYVRRFLQIELHAARANPERRTFQHENLVDYCQRVRTEVIGCVLTIQLAWFAAGCPRDGDGVGFDADLDRLVTWPLAFAGEGKLADKFNQVKDASPEEQAKLALLIALQSWQDAYAQGGDWTAGQVCRDVGPAVHVGTLDLVRQGLAEALGSPGRAASPKALGKHLSPLLDNPPRGGLVLRSRIVHGRVLYSVGVA